MDTTQLNTELLTPIDVPTHDLGVYTPIYMVQFHHWFWLPIFGGFWLMKVLFYHRWFWDIVMIDPEMYLKFFRCVFGHVYDWKSGSSFSWSVVLIEGSFLSFGFLRHVHRDCVLHESLSQNDNLVLGIVDILICSQWKFMFLPSFVGFSRVSGLGEFESVWREFCTHGQTLWCWGATSKRRVWGRRSKRFSVEMMLHMGMGLGGSLPE